MKGTATGKPLREANKRSAKRPAKKEKKLWELRLYVAGQTPKSLIAFANLKAICEEHLPGCYAIEVIDLLVNPQLAKGRPDHRHPHAGEETARADPQDHRGSVQHGAGARRPRSASSAIRRRP